MSRLSQGNFTIMGDLHEIDEMEEFAIPEPQSSMLRRTKKTLLSKLTRKIVVNEKKVSY